MVRDKVRIRFRKGGDLRLVSHHDLMRCFERMLRRADLPFHATQGFNPKPRMVFALSLALGVVGAQEVVELELDAQVEPEEVARRLTVQAPAGLEILSVRRIEPRAGAQVCRVCYAVSVPAERLTELEECVRTLLAAPHCWVERTRPHHRRLDVRSTVRDLHVQDGMLIMDLLITPQGTARPDEVLGVLGFADLLDTGAVLERTLLELQDEQAIPSSPAGAYAPPGD